MSLRKAINDKCKDCIYDPKCGGGTWRQQVSDCAIKSCPLWPVRPKSAGGPRVEPTPPLEPPIAPSGV